jgi:hypothetical protein
VVEGLLLSLLDGKGLGVSLRRFDGGGYRKLSPRGGEQEDWMGVKRNASRKERGEEEGICGCGTGEGREGGNLPSAKSPVRLVNPPPEAVRDLAPPPGGGREKRGAVFCTGGLTGFGEARPQAGAAFLVSEPSATSTVTSPSASSGSAAAGVGTPATTAATTPTYPTATAKGALATAGGEHSVDLCEPLRI